MRRCDREVTDFSHINDIISRCDCLRLGFVDNNEAYIVPVNFGFEIEQDNKLALYFHSAAEGRKVKLLLEQEYISFEMDTKHELVEADIACGFSCLYQCVMGKAGVEILKDNEKKKHGLNIIMSHYSKQNSWNYNEEMLDRVLVVELSVTELSCKEH